MDLNTFLANLSRKLRGNPLFYNGLSRRLYNKYQSYRKKKVNKNFLKHGLSVLSDFDKAMTGAGFPYVIGFGTLLGAIRDKGFIPYDDDIDTSMWISDWSPNIRSVLENAGFKLLHTFDIDDKRFGYEETYIKKGVLVDIFFFYPAIEKYSYFCDFQCCPGSASFYDSMKRFGRVIARRLDVPMSKEIIRIPFKNIEVNIPANYEEVLSFRYGKNYMIPQANWTWEKEYPGIPNPYVNIWNDVVATCKFFH